MPEIAKPSRSHRDASIVVGLVALYSFGLFNYWVPILRFTSPLANSLAFAALQIVPLTLAAAAVSSGSWWARALTGAVLLPVVAVAVVFGSCAAIQSTFIIADGADASFERLEVVPLAAGHLAIYRTNGGATTSFGVSVRHECRLVPGLLRVRNVWSKNPAYTVRAQTLSSDLVLFSSPSYGERRPNQIVEEVRLDPLWCPFAG